MEKAKKRSGSSSTCNAREYVYIINYQDNEQDLCALEMMRLFQIKIQTKYFFSAQDVVPSRSPFIKYKLSIIAAVDSLDELENYIIGTEISFASFNFQYVNVDANEIRFDVWKKAVAQMESAIIGQVNYENPNIILSIIQIESRWFFAECYKNDNEWKYHEHKPHTNSHSLNIRTARALVNIAVGTNLKLKVIDPCCGMGTVVIEAASMGIAINGYEINGKVAAKAKENLAFFGVENAITCGDMHEIQDHFDVAIIDIPYGLFTPVLLDDQIKIVKTARRISDMLILISFDGSEKILTDAGFTITDYCGISKGKFTRHIQVCK